jgi:hypothetical protein
LKKILWKTKKKKFACRLPETFLLTWPIFLTGRLRVVSIVVIRLVTRVVLVVFWRGVGIVTRISVGSGVFLTTALTVLAVAVSSLQEGVKHMLVGVALTALTTIVTV